MNKTGLIAIVGGGICVALLLGVLLFTSGENASATKSQGLISQPASISTEEANTWAEARAADTASSYKVYLAAFPDGAFVDEANQSIGRVTEAAAKPKAATVTRVVESSSAQRGPSRATIRANCQAHVNRVLPPPSKTTRAATGAAAGCGVGALAGGNDTRNCAVGAVVGGATGYVTAGNRERKRDEMFQTCVANGGPG